MVTKKTAKKQTTALAQMKYEPAMTQVTQGQRLMQQAIELVADVLQQNPTPAAVTAMKAEVDSWKKPLEDLSKVIRERLLAYVTENGEPDGDHGLHRKSTFTVGGKEFSAKVEVQRHSTPDPARLRVLLASKKLKESDGFSSRVEVVPDTDKLAVLVASGKLSQEEVDECRTVKAQVLKVSV